MKLTGIETALRAGGRLHGFRSGGGLRVISIQEQDKLRGYGEHPRVDDALLHANEDFLAGGRPYNEVYGKTKLHYLTGSQSFTSPLDLWILRGRTIDAYFEGKQVFVELKALSENTEVPKRVVNYIKRTGKPVLWMSRGHWYDTEPSEFPNGEPCLSTMCLDKDAWFYHMVKTGKGRNFSRALENAFRTKPVEVC